MAFLLANLFFFILLLILLVISGIFSGIETVLFSLSRHDRARMKKSPNRLEALAASLLDKPRELLTSLLVGNMTCNIIIFILSSLILSRLNDYFEQSRHAYGWISHVLIGALAVVPPLLVTYMSDVFPKVIGSLNNTRIAPLIALPVATLIRILWPVSTAIDIAIMRPVHRLVGPRAGGSGNGSPGGFSTDELRELLEMSQQQGVIDVSENELLQEVVRIADLKVKDVMTPRVDITAFNIKDPTDRLMALFRSSHLDRLLVYEGQIDNVIGLIYAKTILLEPDITRIDSAAIRKFLQGVRFVPELQTLERLLHHFRQTRTQLAVAVDEFGGLVGVVTLTDVVEQMVGDLYEPHDMAAHTIERVGPDEYLVPGDLSMADWIDAFGAHVETTHTTTVAGLLAALLKRLPKAGDEVKLAHLSMRVESMRGKNNRRVDKVRLKLLTPEPDSKESGGTP